MSANDNHAVRVCVKVFNSAFNFYTFQFTSTLSGAANIFVYPPLYVQNDNILHVMGWFEWQKKEFVDYYEKRNVISWQPSRKRTQENRERLGMNVIVMSKGTILEECKGYGKEQKFLNE